MTCYDLWLLMLELKPEGERREGKGSNDAQFSGFERRLRAVTHAQFSQDARQVILHRAHGDDQVISNLLVAGSLAEQAEDLQFAFGERLDQGLR